MSNLAAYYVALDCFDDARAHAARALEAARDLRAPVVSAFIFQHVAAIAALQDGPRERGQVNKLEQAAMLLGFVESQLSSLGARRDYTESQELDRVVAALRSVLGERLDELMRLGAQWTQEAAASATTPLLDQSPPAPS